MNRIFVFGCSHVFGSGLPDCISEDKKSSGPYPSKLTFPNIIAKEFSYECINLSKPGSSNKSIVVKVCNNIQMMDTDDICLIHWSHPERYCLETEEGIIDVCPWAPWKIDKTYYKHIHNMWDAVYSTFRYIDYINLKLKARNITSIHTKPVNLPHPFVLEKLTSTMENGINFAEYNLYNFAVDKALDDIHLGTKSHELMANRMLIDFKEIFLKK